MPAIGRGPAAPLNAIDRSQVALRIGPLVPDGDAPFLQPAHIGIAAQKPQQLHDYALGMDLFGGDERKAFCEVKTHLVTEDGAGARARAIGLDAAVLMHVPHEVFVLMHFSPREPWSTP